MCSQESLLPWVFDQYLYYYTMFSVRLQAFFLGIFHKEPVGNLVIFYETAAYPFCKEHYAEAAAAHTALCHSARRLFLCVQANGKGTEVLYGYRKKRTAGTDQPP